MLLYFAFMSTGHSSSRVSAHQWTDSALSFVGGLAEHHWGHIRHQPATSTAYKCTYSTQHWGCCCKEPTAAHRHRLQAAQLGAVEQHSTLSWTTEALEGSALPAWRWDSERYVKLLHSGNRNIHGKFQKQNIHKPELCFLWTQVTFVFIATYTFVINTILAFSYTCWCNTLLPFW